MHSTVTDIREQQKLALLEEQEMEKASIAYNSINGLENIQEDLESSGHSDYYSRDKTPSSLTPQNTPTHVTKGVLEINIERSNSTDEDVLRDFLGEENVDKLSYFSRSRKSFAGSSETDSSYKSFEQNKLSTSKSTKTMDELKLEAKKEGRSSVAFEMQLLRQKLQEEAKSALDAFDKEFDSTPSSLPTFLEVEKKSYRHSILNRMDELLYPPSREKTNSGHRSNHVRQSSEPVEISQMMWGQSSPTHMEENKARNGSHFTTSKSTHFHSRKTSEPAHSSFRIPTSRTYQELTRRGSDGKERKEEIAAKFGVQFRHQTPTTHYDTTVIKRKSSSSSRDNTLEKKKKHPLQYSVESLNNEESVRMSPQNGRHDIHDFDIPEHKSVGTRNIQSDHRNGASASPRPSGKGDTLPSLYRSEKPKVAPKLSYQNIEVHPETSSSLSQSYTGLGEDISPYMTSSQAKKDYLNEIGNNFVYKPYKQQKPLNPPYKNKGNGYSNML